MCESLEFSEAGLRAGVVAGRENRAGGLLDVAPFCP